MKALLVELWSPLDSNCDSVTKYAANIRKEDKGDNETSKVYDAFYLDAFDVQAARSSDRDPRIKRESCQLEQVSRAHAPQRRLDVLTKRSRFVSLMTCHC